MVHKARSKEALIATHVSKLYRLGKHDVTALSGVDLTVQRGDFIAIAGSSGSGKTTFLNLLGCLDRPTRGDIIIDGVDTHPLNDGTLARLRAVKIGFIFQTFNLIPTLNAIENVEYPLLLLGESGSMRREQAREILERVGLGKHLHHRPAALSGGQRQRVAIARAIVKNPSIVLADEPTASLDAKNAEEILKLMADLNAEKGTTFVISSHDPKVLARVSRTYYLEHGKMIGERKTGELSRVA